MPWGLNRFQEAGNVHFLTFSCYRRRANLDNETAPALFVQALERVRRDYGLCVYAYVVMPEHVHLLLNEPERSSLAQAIKSLKQGVARRLALRAQDSFWQAPTRAARDFPQAEIAGADRNPPQAKLGRGTLKS